MSGEETSRAVAKAPAREAREAGPGAGENVELDLDYVRSAGEEVRARLFPRPKQVFDPERGEKVDGPTPFPLPVSIRYQPSETVDVEVLFVPERSIQHVGGTAPDVLLSQVRVVYGDRAFTVDLAFGSEPSAGEDAATALLRSVTGMV